MSLAEIHLPAVPHYATKLQKSMDRFFLRLQPDTPYMRFNYAVTVSPELFHPDSHHNLTPEVLAERGIADGEGDESAGKLSAESLWLRVERQTLQRLPRSKGILFSIRTYMTRMDEVAKEDAAAGALRTQIESYSEEVARYKNKGLWWNALRRHLDEIAAKKADTSITQEAP
jgi:dimethylamine monooxygenase subunit A